MGLSIWSLLTKIRWSRMELRLIGHRGGWKVQLVLAMVEQIVEGSSLADLLVLHRIPQAKEKLVVQSRS